MSQKQIRYINTQSGRSMVEMLGTLAIMGVLTIGGIAGYRYAINKSNANTILNAVSQMAVTASTELTTQGSLTLPEWKDASGNLSISGAFGVETARYDDGAFGIIVSNMNDEVCERIKGMDWKVPEDVAINDETGVCDQGEANTIEFVFNNTLTKKSAPGNAGGEDAGATCDPACTGDMTCQDGSCACPAGRALCDSANGTCCAVGEICTTAGGVAGTCVKNTDGCTTNADCASTEFCQITASSCTAMTGGTCTALSSVSYEDKSVSGFGTLRRSGSTMSWWSAKNWCEAHGKRLIKIDNNRLDCYDASHTAFGTTTTRYCCASDATDCNSTLTNQSAKMQALRGAWSSGFHWTDTDYNTCSAFTVTLGSGYVANANRAIVYYALCE